MARDCISVLAHRTQNRSAAYVAKVRVGGRLRRKRRLGRKRRTVIEEEEEGGEREEGGEGDGGGDGEGGGGEGEGQGGRTPLAGSWVYPLIPSLGEGGAARRPRRK